MGRERLSSRRSDQALTQTHRTEARLDRLRPKDLEAAWALCADLYCSIAEPTATWDHRSFYGEMLFCLLGGFGVSYELARSAAAVIGTVQPFNPTWCESVLARRLVTELSQPQFEPLSAAGGLRRYRFPNRKSDLLIRARRWVLSQGDVATTLLAIPVEVERRRFLCSCPGIGPKTASWLLRNVGLAHELAILDVHVVRALKAAGRIGTERLPRDYEVMEDAFLDWCKALDAPPAAFDLFVWEWQRGSLYSPVV